MELHDRLRIIQRTIRDEYTKAHSTPWIIGFSGGKDSTLLTQLVIQAVLSVAPEHRKRKIFIVSNDTLVESPLFQGYVDSSLIRMEAGISALGLPIEVAKTRPKGDETFWVNLLGKGYPAPNRTFRWCTDRMKIRPTSQFIKGCISAEGEAILLLGVRASESPERAKNLARRDREAGGERLRPHDDLKGCLIFCPIQELTTDDVWVALIQSHPPWGGRHSELFKLYQDASDGECPFVIGDGDAASCGSTSARFGCWTCTVVEKDRSLTALVGEGNGKFQGLLDFRELLKSVSGNPEFRSKTRRNGMPGLGPITLKGRSFLLDELLRTQAACEVELISSHEIRLIKEQWGKDGVTEVLRELQVS